MGRNLTGLSLSALFIRLHESIISTLKGLEELVEENKSVDLSEVREIRDHIHARLTKGEESIENEKLLKLLDLFSTNKAVIEIIKEDSEEWLALLEAIERHIKSVGSDLTDKEKYEIDNIKQLTESIKQFVRKQDLG